MLFKSDVVKYHNLSEKHRTSYYNVSHWKEKLTSQKASLAETYSFCRKFTIGALIFFTVFSWFLTIHFNLLSDLLKKS